MGESPTYKIFNDPNPNLNFKVGLLDKLLIWDETNKKYVFNTEELENCNVGDFYVAGYSEESAFPTFLIEENEDPQYCKGASLIINTDGGPMFISHMPGEQGIPLVGQGDSVMPKYSPTVKYLGIGCDPALIPEAEEDTFYDLTVCNKSLFCNNIVFGKVNDREGTNNFTIGNYNKASAQGLISATTLRFKLTSGSQTVTTIMNPSTFINGTYKNTTSLHSAQFIAADDEITYISKRYNASKVLATTAQLSVTSTGFAFENTDNIASLTNKVTINQTSGIILQAQQKDKPVSTITMANGDIQISSPSVNISSNSGQILQTDPLRSSWWNGRENAMIRLNQIDNLVESNKTNGYFPMLSLKSRSGSWDIGTIPGESSHCNKLIFTYITDSDYDTGKKTGENPTDIGNQHIKFASNFVIETQGICTKNYGTEPPEAASGGNIIEPDPDTIVNKQKIIQPGTVYFKIIE